MATGTAPLSPAAIGGAGLHSYQLVNTITYASPGTTVTKVIGTLPKGAMVTSGGAYVTTAFNDSGTDVIDIGTVADPDGFATLLDVSSVGYKVLDELATTDDYSASAELIIVATYTGQNANASAGAATIIINFTMPQNWTG